MFRKIISGASLVLLLICMLTSAFNLVILETSVAASTNSSSLTSSEPPPTQWARTYGGAADDRAYSVLQTSDGGYLVVGATSSFGAGGLDIWMVKTDASLNMQWNKTHGFAGDDVAYSVVQTSDGGYAMAGYTTSNFTHGQEDFCLLKTNSAGNTQWVWAYGGVHMDVAQCVVQTSDGGYAVAGYTESVGASRDFYLVKTNSTGNMLWSKTFDYHSQLHADSAYSVVQTIDGGYAIAGKTVPGVSDEADGWFIKTDSVGNMEYDSTGVSGDCVYSLVQTSDRGYTIAGASNGDFWLARPPRAAGEWGEWYRTYGGAGADEGYSIRQLSDGGYVAAGQTASYGDGSDDFWVIRTDSLGNMVWNKTGGYAATVDRARSVIRTSDGGYAIAGYTNHVPGAGGYDFVLVKYGTEIPPTYTLTITATVGGTTSPAPGAYTYSAGTTVDVTALPDAHYVFDHWELDGSGVGAANPISVAMGANHTLHAVFSVDWWPTFRHDLSHTGYSTSTAPNTNTTLWTYVLSREVTSSPAVADGKVYVGSWDGKVYCLDALTGAHIWNYTTGGDVYSSPAVADGKVYVGSDDGKVYCLDALTGAHIWNYTTGTDVTSSPAVADGKVYVGSLDHKVYCLDALTGAHIWNYTTGYSVFSSPAVADGKVYVGSDDWKVYCLDASDGAQIWSYTTGHWVRSSPAVADGKVYIGFGCELFAFGPPANLIIDDILVDNKGCTVYANDTYANETAYYVPVNITVENVGDLDAGSFTVSLTVYWTNGSLQEDYVEWRVSGLNLGENTTLTYSWHPIHTGYYNLTAMADCLYEVPESNETDNTLVVPDYPVALMGDLDGSHENDISDVLQVGLAWHTRPGDLYWDIQADLNHDGYINILDIIRVALRWHQTW